LCLVWSDELFHTSGLAPEALLRARPVFDEMRTEVTIGQYLDVLTQVTGDTSLEWASKVARYKSAKYTVERPLLLGAALAAAPAEVTAAYSAYGMPLGEAFQLRSEEHTSELQSRENLVCRLLLEKKKKNTTKAYTDQRHRLA